MQSSVTLNEQPPARRLIPFVQTDAEHLVSSIGKSRQDETIAHSNTMRELQYERSRSEHARLHIVMYDEKISRLSHTVDSLEKRIQRLERSRHQQNAQITRLSPILHKSSRPQTRLDLTAAANRRAKVREKKTAVRQKNESFSKEGEVKVTPVTADGNITSKSEGDNTNKWQDGSLSSKRSLQDIWEAVISSDAPQAANKS